MIIGVIGPNDIKYLKDVNKNAESVLLDLARVLANSGHELLLTPEKKSILEFVGQNYIKLGGKQVNALRATPLG